MSEAGQIPSTMRAVICHGPENYTLEQIPVPTPGTGEALIKVDAVGICASDLKCYHGAAKFWGDANRPAWAETEVVPGHEFVGTVVQLDEAAAARWGIEVGDRVTSEQIVPCWECRYCMTGNYHMCAPHIMYGFKRATPGAMAEYMVYKTNAKVHKISPDLSPAHAAFVEPLSCALHAVERAQLTFDDTVVVAGCGPIGLGMIAGAKAKNPARIIALDVAPQKLALAKKTGADLTINIAEEDPIQIIQGLTDGYGADVYLEGTGHPSAVAQGLNVLRKLGRYVEYSVFGSDVSVDWSIISDDKELDVLGAHLGPNCWPAAVRLLESGALPMDEIVTHQLPLADFQKGLDLVASGSESIKVSLLHDHSPWVGTSWKMTKTLAEATDFVDTVLAAGPPAVDVQPFFLPPLTALATVRDRLGPDTGYLLGAQNADWAEEGPRTGEVSMRMIADAGARLVEIGHSERRVGFAETDDIVAAKVATALRHRLRPLICVGESAEVREQGFEVDFLVRQTRAALAPVRPGEFGSVLLAYEPVWAIGAHGRPAEPNEIGEAMAAIRQVIDEIAGNEPIGPVLYGGGVNLDNAAALLDSPGVDGLFVGRAAWSPAGFLSLISIAAGLVTQQS